MSDPTRLLASADATDLERALLRSWHDERPSAAARQQTFAVLGLTGAAAVGGLAAGSSIAPKAIAAGWLVMAKWAAIGVVAVTATVAGTYAVVHSRSAHEGSSNAAAVPTEPVIAPKEHIETQPAVIELPNSAPRTPAHTTAGPAASLAQQVAAVDRARATLDSGEPARAKRLVDAYESEYPGGAFIQEAEVIRIDALLHEGNRAEAERTGKRFLAAYPKSAHVVRVRALLPSLRYDP